MKIFAMLCAFGQEAAGRAVVQDLGIDLAYPVFGVPKAGISTPTHWVLYTDVSEETYNAAQTYQYPQDCLAQCAEDLSLEVFLASHGMHM